MSLYVAALIFQSNLFQHNNALVHKVMVAMFVVKELKHPAQNPVIVLEIVLSVEIGIKTAVVGLYAEYGRDLVTHPHTFFPAYI